MCRYNFTYRLWLCEISGYRRCVVEAVAPLGFYAALVDSSLPIVRNSVFVPSSGPIGCPETSVNDYYKFCLKTQKSKDFSLWFIQYRVLSSEYRVIQEERSIFWEVIVSVIVRKKFISTCV